jgi:hypothetical protein
MIPAGVLAVLGFLCAGFAANAPWFVEVTPTVAGTVYPKVQMSFLFVRPMNVSTYPVHYNWCTTSSSQTSTCDELRYTLLALQIAFCISAVLFLVGAILAFLRKIPALFLLCFALTLEGATIFAFFFRALPLLEQQYQEKATATTVSWSFSYSSYVALGGLVVGFLSVVVCGALIQGVRKEAALAEMEALASTESLDGSKTHSCESVNLVSKEPLS